MEGWDAIRPCSGKAEVEGMIAAAKRRETKALRFRMGGLEKDIVAEEAGNRWFCNSSPYMDLIYLHIPPNANLPPSSAAALLPRDYLSLHR